MDANIFLGGAVLTLALVSGGFLAAIVLAASDVRPQRAGEPSYAAKTGSRFIGPAKGLLAVGPADCYYQCMSGFRWSDDWGNLCGEACEVGGKLSKS
jgi:hypothetical protein